MCIVFLAYQTLPHLPLVLAANRDEFFDRPTMPLHFWPDYPTLLAGKDMQAGGTWLGITRCGRVAVVTNYRDVKEPKPQAPSRGSLLTDFLLNPDLDTSSFATYLNEQGHSYNGFNLIFGNVNNLYYYSNVEGQCTELKPGVYGLSNHLLDTPWPKVTLGKELLAELPTNPDQWSNEVLFKLLTNDRIPPDHLLPQTGVGMAYERMLGGIFVSSDTYGTRSSSVIKVDCHGEVHAEERSWLDGPNRFESKDHRFFLDSDVVLDASSSQSPQVG